MGGAGGERLRGVGADPLHNLVQLGASASACVRARSLTWFVMPGRSRDACEPRVSARRVCENVLNECELGPKDMNERETWGKMRDTRVPALSVCHTHSLKSPFLRPTLPLSYHYRRVAVFLRGPAANITALAAGGNLHHKEFDLVESKPCDGLLEWVS